MGYLFKISHLFLEIRKNLSTFTSRKKCKRAYDFQEICCNVLIMSNLKIITFLLNISSSLKTYRL